MQGELATTQAHYREQIPGMPMRCVGENRKGGRCRNTPIQGGSVCELHGGKVPSVQVKAGERVVEYEAEKALLKLGVPITVEPRQALLDQVYTAYGMAQTLGAMLQNIEDPEILGSKSERRRSGVESLINQHQKWVAQAAKIAKMALDAGIEERMVRLAEFQATLVVNTIKAVISKMELEPEAQKQALRYAAQALRELTSGQTAAVPPSRNVTPAAVPR